jgi:hypothetical protein
VSTAAATTPAPTTRADDECRIHQRRPQVTQVIPGDARDRSFYSVARLLDPRRAPDAVRCSAQGAIARRSGAGMICARVLARSAYSQGARDRQICAES